MLIAFYLYTGMMQKRFSQSEASESGFRARRESWYDTSISSAFDANETKATDERQ